MTLASAPPPGTGPGAGFVVEDLITGQFASGFGRLDDGRSFAFHVHRGLLEVQIYRTRRAVLVPSPDDVVATASRALTDVDVHDARSLSAAVRDTAAGAVPVR